MEQTFDTLARLFSLAMVRYFVIAGIPFLIFYVCSGSRLAPSKIQIRKAGLKDFVREILHSVQTSIVFVVLAYLVIFSPIRHYTRIYPALSDRDWWYLPFSVMLSLIIHDTYFYWMHRLLHSPRLFKLSHVLHHKSTNPSPWASYSFHFTEAWTEGFVLVVIVFIVPMHPYGILTFTIIAFMINVYGHLGFEIAPRRFRNSVLFKILNSSVHHNLHHSRFKGNYGLYFRLWDRLMDTEQPGYEKEYDRIQENRFNNL